MKSPSKARRGHRIRRLACALGLVCAGPAGCAQPRTDNTSISTAQPSSQPVDQAPVSGKGPVDDGGSIGSATMKADGTIVLLLRATTAGITGDSQLVYPPGHPQYQEVLKHLGGLKPGEEKPVPPWPD